MSLERLKKHKTIPFLNIGSSNVSEWARIGKSTVFDLVLNAQTETSEFIEDENPTDEIKYYKPEMAQELQCNKGDPAFDYLYDMFYNLPTGEDVKKNVLIVFAGNIETTASMPEKFRAWNTTSTLILDHLDTVAEKIYFKISINKIERGTCTVDNGTPIFVPKGTVVAPLPSPAPDTEDSGGESEENV